MTVNSFAVGACAPSTLRSAVTEYGGNAPAVIHILPSASQATAPADKRLDQRKPARELFEGPTGFVGRGVGFLCAKNCRAQLYAARES